METERCQTKTKLNFAKVTAVVIGLLFVVSVSVSAQIVVGHCFDDPPGANTDLGPGGRGIYMHPGGNWDSTDNPAYYSNQVLGVSGSENPPVAACVTGAVPDELSSITFVAWIKEDPDVNPAYDRYIFAGVEAGYDSAGEMIVWLENTTKKLRFNFYGSSGQQFYAVSNDSVGGSNWTHIAIVFSKGHFNMYANGAALARTMGGTATGVIPALATREIYYGACPFSQRNFDGKLDEMAIFSEPLGQNQIQEIIDNGLERFFIGDIPEKVHFIVGHALNEQPDIGLYGTGIYMHPDAEWSGANYAPGGYSSQSLYTGGSAELPPVPSGCMTLTPTVGGRKMSFTMWLNQQSAGFTEDGNHSYILTGSNMVTNQQGDAPGLFQLWMEEGSRNLHFTFYNESAEPVDVVSEPIPADTWIHLTTVFNEGNVKIYFDGECVTDQDLPETYIPYGPKRELRFASGYPFAKNWLGYLDEFGWFGGALIQSQIQFIIDSGLKAFSYTIPPPRYCGEYGTIYHPADLDKNCRADLADFAVIASDWLECSDPGDINCQ